MHQPAEPSFILSPSSPSPSPSSSHLSPQSSGTTPPNSPSCNSPGVSWPSSPQSSLWPSPSLSNQSTSNPNSQLILAIVITAALTYPAYIFFHQPCDEEDTVKARLALFHSNQGTDPTDEYTPTTADNDSLAHPDPAYWLSSDPNAKAPAGSPTQPHSHSLHPELPNTRRHHPQPPRLSRLAHHR